MERSWEGWSLRPERMRTKDKTKADRALSPRPSPPTKGTRHPIKDAWALVCSSEHWGLNQVNPRRRPVALSTWWVGVVWGGRQTWPRVPQGHNGHVLQCAVFPTSLQVETPQLWAPPPCRKGRDKGRGHREMHSYFSRQVKHTHTRNPRTGNPIETYGNNSDRFLKRLSEGPELRAKLF